MTSDAIDRDAGRAAVNANGAANLVCLAAAPTFAVMALLTAIPGGGPAMVCGSMHDGSPLTGMAGMYLLMSVFHAAPWLRLIARR